jgi:hypothetical protein
VIEFFEELRARNEALFLFGCFNLIVALYCFVNVFADEHYVQGANAWFKPLKFALSIAIYSWSMAWYLHYLTDYSPLRFNTVIILLLGFEIVYITIQASRGELSHFNRTSFFYRFMYGLMGGAAAAVSFYTLYIAGLFFTSKNLVTLPVYYVWAIRLGLLLFVVFSLQGFAMGANQSHTVGAAAGGRGLPFLNWSVTHGDLRVAHFIGMHALQVLPIVSFYMLRTTWATVVFAVLYFLLALSTWIMAFQSIPLVRRA